MNVLLVGGGGREHALAWKIARSPWLRRLVCAPGNPGMAACGELRAVGDTDVAGLTELAAEIRADLVVIGPERALAAGSADSLRQKGIPCFGPSASAARLESSKAFARGFAARWGIPSARFGVFSDVRAAERFLRELAPPYVVKADGLAAGKGVAIVDDLSEARAQVEALIGGRFGAAGARVVIESFLEGEIGSAFALCDGETSMAFGAAQDHKRAFDGERGPNTGGMGAFAPAPLFDGALLARVQRELIDPAFAGIAAEGAPYQGALFCELMATADGPRLVEYNVRFGDPECQCLMLRLQSDILPYLWGAAQRGGLAGLAPPQWRRETAVCVVVAARGYPENPRSGGVVTGLDADFGEDVVVFHAGTRRGEDGALVASGGRVLNVCALGEDLEAARRKAYRAVERIGFADGFWRRDIGWRALARSGGRTAEAVRT